MKLAKVRHRVMAALLDFIILVAIFIVLTITKLPFIISIFKYPEHIISTKFIIDIFRWGILFSVIFIIYYAVFPLIFKGQTVGKIVFKLKVVKDNDQNIDYKTMFYREGIGRIFITFASLGVSIIASTIIMALRDDKRDLLDILAKTKVIDLYESEE